MVEDRGWKIEDSNAGVFAILYPLSSLPASSQRVLVAEEVELDDVVFEQQRDRPVEDDAQPALEAGHLHEVVAPPDPPGEEATQLDPHDPADAVVVTERRERSEAFVDERLQLYWRSALRRADGCDEVPRQHLRLAHRVLGERGVWVSLRIGDGGAITQRPDAAVARHAHARVDQHAPALALFQRHVLQQRIRRDTRGEDDRRGRNALLAGENDQVLLDALDGRARAHVHAACL